MRISCFITSHGFGHATRTFAVLHEIAKKFPQLKVSVFSTLPKFFLKENLKPLSFKLNFVNTDVGLVQKSPFEHDLQKTISKLEYFLSFKDPALRDIKNILCHFDPHFILNDISPLGLKLGKELNIPTLLLENFTWDWIYSPYEKNSYLFTNLISDLKEIFSSADLRIQTNPICEKIDNSPLVNPIFREGKKSDFKLEFERNNPIILITTGGIFQNCLFLEKLEKHKNYNFVLTNADCPLIRTSNLYPLSPKSKYSFPDVVKSSSLVVGKAGYGTVAEAWGNNKIFLPVFRKDFRESSILKNFLNRFVTGSEISLNEFNSGTWIEKLDNHFFSKNVKKCSLKKQNGTIQVTEIISNWLNIAS